MFDESDMAHTITLLLHYARAVVDGAFDIDTFAAFTRFMMMRYAI